MAFDNDQLTEKVIALAIEFHRLLPGRTEARDLTVSPSHCD